MPACQTASAGSALRSAALAVRLVGVVPAIDVADVVRVSAVLAGLVELACVLRRRPARRHAGKGEGTACADAQDDRGQEGRDSSCHFQIPYRRMNERPETGRAFSSKTNRAAGHWAGV